MDVLDADELEFNIGVIVFIFVAFSCSPVRNCIQLERHVLHRQNILSEEQNNFYTILIVVHKHIARMFSRFSCEHIQLAKRSLENKAHLNTYRMVL